MTVVHLVRSANTSGGVSNVVNNLQREFRQKGVHSEVRSMSDFGWRQRRVKRLTFLNRLLLILDILVTSLILSPIAKRKLRHNTVICHNDFLSGDIYVNHGLHKAMIMENAHPIRKCLTNPLHLFLLARESIRHRLALYKAIVVFSSQQREELLKHYPTIHPDKIRIIPNGVELKRFEEKKTPSQGIKELVFVGHEFDRKGLHYILEAMSHLPTTITLTVLGGDTLQINAYQKRAQKLGLNERVRFMGRVDDPVPYYQQADLFVFPTQFEPWGLVGIEALACGTPILATMTGSIPDYLTPNHNGLAIMPESQSIATGIQQLINNPDLFAVLQQNARASVEKFDWSIVADRYLELIAECEHV